MPSHQPNLYWCFASVYTERNLTMKPNTILPTTRHRLVMTLGCAIAFLATLLFLTQASTLPSSAASDPFVSPIRPGATPTTPGSPKMFDFSKDLDSNGFPDDFEQAFNHYQKVMHDHPDNKGLIEAERKSNSDRTPYSAKSRAIFAQIERLGKQMEKSKDEAETRAILDEIHALRQQLDEDPVYQITVRYAEMKLREAMDEKIGKDLAQATAEAMQQPTATPIATASASGQSRSAQSEKDSNQPEFAQNRVFLPMISSAKNQAGSVQNNADSNVQSAAATAAYGVYLPMIVSPYIVDFAKLQRGDLLFRNGKSDGFTMTNYAMLFSHDGFFDGNGKTYESNWDIGGVRSLSWDTWRKPIWVAFVRATGKNANGVLLTPTVVQGALDWAKGKYGICASPYPTCTPYNWNILDKNTDSALYCSQLAWKTFRYIQTEVDSESSIYQQFLEEKFGSLGTLLADSGVLPDEVVLDDNMHTYESGMGAKDPSGGI